MRSICICWMLFSRYILCPCEVCDNGCQTYSLSFWTCVVWAVPGSGAGNIDLKLYSLILEETWWLRWWIAWWTMKGVTKSMMNEHIRDNSAYVYIYNSACMIRVGPTTLTIQWGEYLGEILPNDFIPKESCSARIHSMISWYYMILSTKAWHCWKISVNYPFQSLPSFTYMVRCATWTGSMVPSPKAMGVRVVLAIVCWHEAVLLIHFTHLIVKARTHPAIPRSW